MTPTLALTVLSLAVLAQAAPTSSTRNATDTASVNSVAEAAEATAKSLRAVSTATTSTSFSPLPTLASATSVAGFSTATASAIAGSLPGYKYNLTMESEATRISICSQTTAYCSVAGCTKPEANVTTNFCNPTTMGWNCDCNKKADSALDPLVVPVNSYDCRLRTSACLDQCTNPSASPPIADLASCRYACNYILGSTCGTSNQVLPEYQVKKENSKPNTSSGGVAMGISAASLVSPSPLLAIALGVLGGGALLLR
ncbi:hypothetical protein JCM10207_005044 [Rhodosporidiobolus poonsookiae]